MASSTKAGGASFTPDEANDPDKAIYRPKRAEIGYIDRPEQEEEPSVGTDSSQSSEKDKSPSDSEKPSRRQPARTTVSHSKQPEKETDSGAPSTDTDGQKTTRKPSAKKAAVRSTDDEFDDFD